MTNIAGMRRFFSLQNATSFTEDDAVRGFSFITILPLYHLCSIRHNKGKRLTTLTFLSLDNNHQFWREAESTVFSLKKRSICILLVMPENG